MLLTETWLNKHHTFTLEPNEVHALDVCPPTGQLFWDYPKITINQKSVERIIDAETVCPQNPIGTLYELIPTKPDEDMAYEWVINAVCLGFGELDQRL